MASETEHLPHAVKLESSPPCPSCGVVLDGATPVEGVASPRAGDLTVCLYCGAPLAFTEGLGLRLVPLEELRGLNSETKRDFARLRRELARRPRGR